MCAHLAQASLSLPTLYHKPLHISCFHSYEESVMKLTCPPKSLPCAHTSPVLLAAPHHARTMSKQKQDAVPDGQLQSVLLALGWSAQVALVNKYLDQYLT